MANAVDKNVLKQIACAAIDDAADDLFRLSRIIWENPELANKEFKAHDTLAHYLEEKFNFPRVDRNFHLQTALRAVYGEKRDSGIHIAVLSEYDALPEIGHACGHNLIAEVGVAAGVGIKAVLEKSSLQCKVTVLGTPAEEQNGGKIHLIRHGAFDDVDIAMMAHPSSYAVLKPKYLAIKQLDITYHGVESHASVCPWEGVNALDAAVLCYNNVSCLRQQMRPHCMVHGIISHGGARPNIIPGRTALEFYVRSATNSGLSLIETKVRNCAQAAALATGCQLTITDQIPKKTLMSNETMIQLFEENGIALGTQFERREDIIKRFGGSSDIGSVSHVVPTIHPQFIIGTDANVHTQNFTPAAGDRKAQSYTLDCAKALAMTAIDVMTDPKIFERVKADFKRGLQQDSENDA